MKEQDGIQFECAPFEAEWQLVYLEHQGVINYVYTTDGDSIILGVDRVITEIDFKRKEFVIIEKSTILCSEKFPLGRFPPSSWPNIAALLGCDYVARVPGVGALTLFKKILVPCFDSDNNNLDGDDNSRLTENSLRRLKVLSSKVPSDFNERYQKYTSAFQEYFISDVYIVTKVFF